MRKTIIVLLVIVAAVTITLFVPCNSQGTPENSSTTIVTQNETFNTSNFEVDESITVEPDYTYNEIIPLPSNIQAAMQQACKDYGVPYSLALAVAECESSFNLEANSGICWGVMQINPCNYSRLRELGMEPTEYEGNAVAGVFMLGELLNKYSDTHKALMAYNCGEAGAYKLWKQGCGTSSYSRKVTTKSEYWQQILNS